MRNPGRFSRWRRQVPQQQRQIGTRIYHISNPRPVTTTSPIPTPSVTSTTDYQVTRVTANNFWNAPYDTEQHGNPYHMPSNDRLPYNLNIQNPSIPDYRNNNNYSISGSRLPPKRDNYADIPLAQYDNSGYTRRPVGYDVRYSVPYSHFPSVQSNVPPNTGYNNNPGYGYNSGYASTGQASETTFSEEEYDPWAFPKMHSRKTQNYSQVTGDTQWKLNTSPIPSTVPPPVTVTISKPPAFFNNDSPAPRNISPTKREGREK